MIQTASLPRAATDAPRFALRRAPRAGHRADELGYDAVHPHGSRGRHIKARHMVAPFGKNPPIIVEQVVVNTVPTRIGHHRAFRPEHIEQGADERVRAVEQRPHLAHGGMDHHRAASLDTDAVKVVAQSHTGGKGWHVGHCSRRLTPWHALRPSHVRQQELPRPKGLARLIREAWRIRPRSGSRALALGF